MSCLTAWRLPWSLGCPKQFKNVKIWPNNMTVYNDKDLKSKHFRVFFFYISQGCRFKTKIRNQSQKNGLKKAYYCVQPNSGSWSQIAWINNKNVHLITKFYSLKKLLPSHFTTASFVWQRAQLFESYWHSMDMVKCNF